MTINHLLVVTSEPKSVFMEIFFKYVKSKSNILKKKKITLIGNKRIISDEAKFNNYKKNFNEISDIKSAVKSRLNLINIELSKGKKKKILKENIYQKVLKNHY